MALMYTQHWALGLDAGRAVAEQPVGERHWALGRWRICRSRPRKTTPLHWLEASIDAVLLCIVATDSPCGLTVAMNARASYCSHGHLRIEPELQKEPGRQGKLLRVRGSRITSGRLRGNTRGNGATKEKNLTTR